MEDFAEIKIDRREEGGVAIFIKSKAIEELSKGMISPNAKAALASATGEKYSLTTNCPYSAANQPYVKGERNHTCLIWRGHDLYNIDKIPTVDQNKGITDWTYAKYFISNGGAINTGMFQVKGLAEGVTFIEPAMLSNDTLEKAKLNFRDILIGLYRQYMKNPKIQLKLTMEELI